MALIKCVDCGRNVSDRAKFCPHCGAPVEIQRKYQPVAPPKPAAPPKPVTPPKPVAPPKPVSPPKPAAPPKPVTSPNPTAPPKPVTPPNPTAPPKSVAPPKPAAPPKPVTLPNPAAPPKPVTSPKPVAPPIPKPEPVEEIIPESMEEIKSEPDKVLKPEQMYVEYIEEDGNGWIKSCIKIAILLVLIGGVVYLFWGDTLLGGNTENNAAPLDTVAIDCVSTSGEKTEGVDKKSEKEEKQSIGTKSNQQKVKSAVENTPPQTSRMAPQTKQSVTKANIYSGNSIKKAASKGQRIVAPVAQPKQQSVPQQPRNTTPQNKKGPKKQSLLL